ncbi:hypothetical protein SAZ10_29545 [Mesorhizobium sp. BAC0120]|uniref:DUF6894 family protein n=1 Tax=Mesorhizobium sp. BAC0120 TaxID=3090670 RepID=UPI00298C2FCF|nr:hypothetical protein [Mesorhizobium sp. BAC0120]MDW6025911.1 hypothetical protein [Mesorhizobium sp. BAC0120]
MRYFFDSRDGETVVRDRNGIECRDFDCAKHEAAKGLADLASDVLPACTLPCKLSIEIRDESGSCIVVIDAIIDLHVLAFRISN